MSPALAPLLHGRPWREILTSAVDIFVVYYVIYRALLLVKGTRAAQMLVGLGLMAGAFFVARVFELTTLLWLLDNFINYSIIFLIIIFQHDIRRGLSRVGANVASWGRTYETTYVLEEVIQAAEQLARTRMGALIVFERDAGIDDFLRDPGEVLDARVTKELLLALFVPSPQNSLHDGAAVIRNLRLHRAGSVLPLSANAHLDKALGTRHRAAVGITEETDAVVVVVSEQRGAISLCFGGNIARDLDGPTLRKALLGLLQKPRPKWRRRVPTRTDREPTERTVLPLHEVVAAAPEPAPEPDDAVAASAAASGGDLAPLDVVPTIQAPAAPPPPAAAAGASPVPAAAGSGFKP